VHHIRKIEKPQSSRTGAFLWVSFPSRCFGVNNSEDKKRLRDISRAALQPTGAVLQLTVEVSDFRQLPDSSAIQAFTFGGLSSGRALRARYHSLKSCSINTTPSRHVLHAAPCTSAY
jgi:hypothetical protein